MNCDEWHKPGQRCLDPLVSQSGLVPRGPVSRRLGGQAPAILVNHGVAVARRRLETGLSEGAIAPIGDRYVEARLKSTGHLTRVGS